VERILPIEHWPPSIPPVDVTGPSRRAADERKRREERRPPPNPPARPAGEDGEDDGQTHVDVTA
jgi:hypothetical protein